MSIQRALYEKKLDFEIPTPSQAEKMDLEYLDALVLDIDQMIRTRAVIELPKKFVAQAAGAAETATPHFATSSRGSRRR